MRKTERLWGALGGLFTMYALFKRSDLFKRYASASPAIRRDNDVLLDSEAAYASQEHTEIKFVFVGHGTEESNVQEYENFRNKMTARKYDHLELNVKMLTGVGHSGTKAIGYTGGYSLCFEK